MTPTDRSVTRVTLGAYPSQTGISGRGYGRLRPIVLTIGPGDSVALRWGGTRTRYTLGIEYIMRHAHRFAIRAREAEKREQRVQRKKARKS
jgi:hypothetical protein